MNVQERINEIIKECETYIDTTLESIGCDDISYSIRFANGEWECEVDAITSLGEEDDRIITCDNIENLLEKIKEDI